MSKILLISTLNPGTESGGQAVVSFLGIAVLPSDFITPESYWSLWVPLLFLALILLAAVYFVRVKIR